MLPEFILNLLKICNNYNFKNLNSAFHIGLINYAVWKTQNTKKKLYCILSKIYCTLIFRTYLYHRRYPHNAPRSNPAPQRHSSLWCRSVGSLSVLKRAGRAESRPNARFAVSPAFRFVRSLTLSNDDVLASYLTHSLCCSRSVFAHLLCLAPAADVRLKFGRSFPVRPFWCVVRVLWERMTTTSVDPIPRFSGNTVRELLFAWIKIKFLLHECIKRFNCL